MAQNHKCASKHLQPVQHMTPIIRSSIWIRKNLQKDPLMGKKEIQTNMQ